MPLIKITPNQDFLHGRTRYEKDKEYEVSEGEAYYFAANGWTTDRLVESDESVTLEIHNGQIGHTSEVK